MISIYWYYLLWPCSLFLMLICLQVENCLRKTCVAIKKLAFFQTISSQFCLPGQSFYHISTVQSAASLTRPFAGQDVKILLALKETATHVVALFSGTAYYFYYLLIQSKIVKLKGHLHFHVPQLTQVKYLWPIKVCFLLFPDRHFAA